VEGSASCTQCPASTKSSQYRTSCEVCENGKYSTIGSGSCAICGGGSVPSENQSECKKCLRGKSATVGESTCQSCEEGKFSIEGAMSCELCNTGKVAKIERSQSCTHCPAGKWSTDDRKRCALCSQGKISLHGSSSCHICSGGTVPNTDASACDSCSAGKFALAGDISCSICANGTYSGIGSSSCSMCASGKISSAVSGSEACTSCAAGTKSSDDKTECLDCSGGTYSGMGSSSCSLCPSGKISEVGSAACTACPGGTKSSDEKTECIECQGGTYSELGSSSCTLCDGGTYCPPNSATMDKCPVGKYAGSGSVSCSQCSWTTFQDELGMSSCKECPMNQQGNEGHISCECKPGFAPAFTNDGVLDCKCNPGYTYEAGKCTMCPPGTYKKEIGNGACSSCDKTAVRGSFSTMSSIMSATTSEIGKVGPPTSPLNCTCEKGDFLLEGKPSAEPDFVGHGYCSRCPEGTNCVERGVTLESLPLKPSYWRSDQNSFKVELCYAPEACPQANSTGNVSTASQCAEGHVGPICNICKHGYSKSVFGLCQICDKEVNVPIELIIILLMVAIFVVLMARAVQRHLSKEQKKRKVKRNKRSMASHIRTKSKILTSFYQILSGYESSLQIRFPPVFENITRWISSVANLNALQLVKADCLMETSFYTRLLFITIAPIAITVLIFLYMFCARKLTDSSNILRKKAIRNTCVEVFLGLTYLVFASVVSWLQASDSILPIRSPLLVAALLAQITNELPFVASLL